MAIEQVETAVDVTFICRMCGKKTTVTVNTGDLIKFRKGEGNI